jgi:hypothetical protein
VEKALRVSCSCGEPFPRKDRDISLTVARSCGHETTPDRRPLHTSSPCKVYARALTQSTQPSGFGCFLHASIAYASRWLFSCLGLRVRMGSVSAGIPRGVRVFLLCRTSTSRTRPAQQLDGGRPTTSRRTLSRRNLPVLFFLLLWKMDAWGCRSSS